MAGFKNDCLGIMNLLPIFHIKIIIKLSMENFCSFPKLSYTANPFPVTITGISL
jgi:hypothetical protein